MCLRSGCSLNKLRFGEKVQIIDQPVGRCQGSTEKDQTNEKRVKKTSQAQADSLICLRARLQSVILGMEKKKTRSQIGHLFDVTISLCYIFPWGTKRF